MIFKKKNLYKKNSINEFASSLSPYFKTGKIDMDSFKYVIKNNIHVGNS